MEFHYRDKKDGEFSLVDATDLKFDAGILNPNCYKIIWAKDDDISLGVDGYRIFLKKSHLLFTTPLNTLDLLVENKKVITFSFNREFYCIRDHDSEVACNGFLFLGSSQPIMVELTSIDQINFNFLYEFFVEEFETVDHIQGEMLLVLLKRLLIKSVRIARNALPIPGIPGTKLDAIRKFNLLVEMHFREKHKVSEYADLMNLSPKSLSNLFSRYHSDSPLKVISRRIVLEAKRLLDFSDKNINEIASDLGFEEASHFSKLFRTQVGQSPKQYKESSHLE